VGSYNDRDNSEYYEGSGGFVMIECEDNMLSCQKKLGLFQNLFEREREREREREMGIIYVRSSRELYTVRDIRWIFWVGFRNFEEQRERERERFLTQDSDTFHNSKYIKFVLTFTYLRI
jgi:hypothetical protein